jgi:hypothetical protein
MKNGDHLTGEIKGLKGGVLYVSMKYMLGTSSVQWSEVAHLESKQLFLVTTEDGSVYNGTLNTTKHEEGDQPMKIAIGGTPGEVVIEQPRIAEMDETATKFLKRFNGSVNTGVIYSKGNQSTQYNIGSDVNYPRQRWGAAAPPTTPPCPPVPGSLPPPVTNLPAMPSVSCAGTIGSTMALATGCKAPSRGLPTKPQSAAESDAT